jgi:hypothetical protein
MLVDMYRVLNDLMDAPAVTGFEEPGRKRIIRVRQVQTSN